jgi:hypothetical protein
MERTVWFLFSCPEHPVIKFIIELNVDLHQPKTLEYVLESFRSPTAVNLHELSIDGTNKISANLLHV